MRGPRWLALVLLLAGLALAEPFSAPGTWKVGHGDGTDLMLTLHPDGRALSDWQDQKGRWHWDGERLVVDWTDGWTDIIQLIPGGFEKVAYKPGADRQGPPVNRTSAVRVSSSPGD